MRNRWFPELKKLSDDVEKLEASVEEEVSGLKGENVEMRSHFNAMIKQLNDLTAFVNEKHGHRIIEETLELDTNTPPTDKVPFRCHGC